MDLNFIFRKNGAGVKMKFYFRLNCCCNCEYIEEYESCEGDMGVYRGFKENFCG